MERFKTTILLASILGILIVAVVGVSIASNKKKRNKEMGELFVPVNIDEISKIKIISKKKTQELSKIDNQWAVSSAGNIKADQKAVSDILDCIKEMRKEEIISANSGKKANFEVDEERGVEVKLYKGEDQLADFFVGKAGADFNSTYVRAADEDNVYAVKKFVRVYFDKSDFRDLAIFNFDKEKVSEIVIDQKGKDPVILQKKDGKWKAEWYDKFKMNENKVNSLLSSLSRLSAKDIVSDKDTAGAGFANPKMKIVIKFEDGSEEALNVGSKTDSAYYVKRSANGIIYTLSESTVKEFQKEKDDFAE